MEKPFQHYPGRDNRTLDYDDPNDRITFMTDMEKCVKSLEEKGYFEQYKVDKDKLVNVNTGRKYSNKEVKVLNFYRFEGITNPDDMAILYAIETADGNKGTLADAYGLYADEATGKFMLNVPLHKKTDKEKL